MPIVWNGRLIQAVHNLDLMRSLKAKMFVELQPGAGELGQSLSFKRLSCQTTLAELSLGEAVHSNTSLSKAGHVDFAKSLRRVCIMTTADQAGFSMKVSPTLSRQGAALQFICTKATFGCNGSASALGQDQGHVT